MAASSAGTGSTSTVPTSTEPTGTADPGTGVEAHADPRLVDAADIARAAAEQDAGADAVGAHSGVHVEDTAAVTHLFEANNPGYHGWRWAVTVASGGPDTAVTVSEVVLLPGPQALTAPEWVPWERRVRAGDLGVGDLLPTAPDDPRLVPGYLRSDDPAIEDVVRELGLGRPRVLSRQGRLDAADRWQEGDHGPGSPMASTAPGNCGTCGFYLPLAGSLSAAFGACGNEYAPADGHVVHIEFGCGAHSEVEVELSPVVTVAELVYDDALLDVDPIPAAPGRTRAEPAPEPAMEMAAESATEEAAGPTAMAVEPAAAAEPGTVPEAGSATAPGSAAEGEPAQR